MATAVGSCQSILDIRLLTPLTSYGSVSKTPFQSVVTAPVEVDGRVLLPSGTIVHGTVRRAIRVGIGLIRERATLDVDFQSYELADGRHFPLRARLHSIDNARETVTDSGRIKGILAAGNPQSFVNGVWHTPRAGMFHRSLIGLTGASGRIWTEYSMGVVGAAALFALRCAAFRLPEPEIRLPAGVEMKAVLTDIADDVPSFATVAPAEVPPELTEWIENRPFYTRKPNNQLADDIINLVFIGSQEQLLNAFSAAGWTQPDPLNRRSFRRSYQAYMSQTGYPSAPVSKLIYENAEPDMVFQKSLNTIAKRHHVRVWRAEFGGEPIWMAAATQDVGIALNKRSMTLTHKIDLAVDLERAQIVNDLEFAGCSGPVGYVERAAASSGAQIQTAVVTDGRAAIIRLTPCAASQQQADSAVLPKVPGSVLSRIARRMLLETRHYLLRGNAYYWGYRAIRYRSARRSASP